MGRTYFPQLLEHFQHVGPNGTHSCLFMEPFGPPVLDEAEKSLDYNSIDERLPGRIAWEACKQTVQALEFVHTKGIIHEGQSYFHYLIGFYSGTQT